MRFIKFYGPRSRASCSETLRDRGFFFLLWYMNQHSTVYCVLWKLPLIYIISFDKMYIFLIQILHWGIGFETEVTTHSKHDDVDLFTRFMEYKIKETHSVYFTLYFYEEANAIYFCYMWPFFLSSSWSRCQHYESRSAIYDGSSGQQFNGRRRIRICTGGCHQKRNFWDRGQKGQFTYMYMWPLYVLVVNSIQYNAWAFGLYVTPQNEICLYWVGEGF